ncbi:MAG: YicC/YloC family endoribonuclease [Oscillospiraceae bacterium]
MMNSMTGYGRAQSVVNGREITVELRSVNHRYFELSTRIPRTFGYLEDKIKSYIAERVSRGKIEVTVSIVLGDELDVEVELNMNIVRGYADALKRISDEFGLRDDVFASTLAKFPDVFTVKRPVLDEEEVWNDVRAVLDTSISNYNEMRESEGNRLRDDILSRLTTLEELLEAIEEQSAPRLEAYREKLGARMKAVLENTEIDEGRLLLEAALYADKAAIDEETVRLASHIAQFREIAKSGVPVGRKLDFLTQEINREANTIGSKAGDLNITGAVVDMKAEIEKIREQIQNIE